MVSFHFERVRPLGVGQMLLNTQMWSLVKGLLKGNDDTTTEQKAVDTLEQSGDEEFAERMGVSLIRMCGGRVIQLARDCSVVVDAENSVITVEGEDGEEWCFSVADMCRLRTGGNTDIYWSTEKTSKSSGKKCDPVDYALKFESMEDMLDFRSGVCVLFLADSEGVVERDCAFAEYDSEERSFCPIAISAKLSIRKRKNGIEHILVVQGVRTSSEHVGTQLLFLEAISEDLGIWPQPSSGQLGFWGVELGCTEGDKRMYLAELSALDQSKPVYDIIDLFLGNEHNSTEVQAPDQEESDYGASSSDDEDENVLPNRSVCCRDPTDTLLSAGEDRLVHKFMEVSSDRTFVFRGNNSPTARRRRKDHSEMAVYRQEHGENIEDVGTISGNKFAINGELVVPSRALLHSSEAKLLLGSDQNDESVYLFDLGAEKIVQKWETGHQRVDNMFSSFKGGQASHDPTFICNNSNSLFMMDTRLPSVGRTTTKKYISNVDFTAGATNDFGQIAVGSRLGDLRLYDGKPNEKGEYKRAKTHLETIREPHKSVEVTGDGSWVVATTKTFLVVFDTRTKDGERTGFHVPLGQAKSAPQFLKLKREDIMEFGLTDIDFRPANFDANETCIVTSTGSVAVIWDMESVKKRKPRYKLKFAEHFIKDVRIADDASIVVAFPDDIGIFGTKLGR